MGHSFCGLLYVAEGTICGRGVEYCKKLAGRSDLVVSAFLLVIGELGWGEGGVPMLFICLFSSHDGY